jgi:hypothetical protein
MRAQLTRLTRRIAVDHALRDRVTLLREDVAKNQPVLCRRMTQPVPLIHRHVVDPTADAVHRINALSAQSPAL